MNNFDKPTEHERLRAMLLEDTDTPEQAETLLSTISHLRQWPAPKPTMYETGQLVEHLLFTMPEPPHQRLSEWWPLLLMRAQLHVVRVEIWAASALVITLGIIVTLTSYTPSASVETLPLVLIAPIVAAAGIAFLYGPDVEQAAEIEEATPASGRLVLLARITLVFGFDLALGLGGSAALAVTQTAISLWPLVMAWLAPMAFLSALAFFASVIFTDALIGISASMLVWMFQQLILRNPAGYSILNSLPNLLAADMHPWSILLALVFVLAALWLAGREDRIVNHPG